MKIILSWDVTPWIRRNLLPPSLLLYTEARLYTWYLCYSKTLFHLQWFNGIRSDGQKIVNNEKMLFHNTTTICSIEYEHFPEQTNENYKNLTQDNRCEMKMGCRYINLIGDGRDGNIVENSEQVQIQKDGVVTSLEILPWWRVSFSRIWRRVVRWVSADTCLLAGLLNLFLRPWRWRLYVPPKRRLKLNGLHDVISQKMILFTTTNAKT
jgi:hypothetical protein